MDALEVVDKVYPELIATALQSVVIQNCDDLQSYSLKVHRLNFLVRLRVNWTFQQETNPPVQVCSNISIPLNEKRVSQNDVHALSV